jgi:hypothetical protein
MSTLTLTPSVPPASTVTMLGQIASWTLPAGVVYQHHDIVTALAHAGMDVSLARLLCPRHEFIRAVRKIAGPAIIGEVDEPDSVTFQLDLRVQCGNALNYVPQATCRLDTITGVITCTDAVLLPRLQAEMAAAKTGRSAADINRLLFRAFARETNDPLAIVHLKKGSGVYFVYQQWVYFLDKIQAFISALTVGVGDLARCEIPECTHSIATVATQTAEAIEDVIDDYERDLMGLTLDSSEKAVQKAHDSVQRAIYMVHFRREFLGFHATRLEDHVAYCQKLLRDHVVSREAANPCLPTLSA